MYVLESSAVDDGLTMTCAVWMIADIGVYVCLVVCVYVCGLYILNLIIL